MKKRVNNFPCNCGHAIDEHRLDFTVGMQGCMMYLPGYKWCGCYNYIPNTLKYIEQKYERLPKRVE